MTAPSPELAEVAENVRALGVPVQVAACITERGILRAITHFADPLPELRRYVATLGAWNEPVEAQEWTAARYHIPSYFNVSGWDVDAGIFLYRWTDRTKDWRDPARRYSADVGELLHLPAGWVNHTAERGGAS